MTHPARRRALCWVPFPRIASRCSPGMTVRRITSAHQQLLALRPVEALVQGATKPVEQLADLRLVDDEGRAERDAVPDHRAHDQPLGLAKPRDLRPDLALGFDRLGRALDKGLD